MAAAEARRREEVLALSVDHEDGALVVSHRTSRSMARKEPPPPFRLGDGGGSEDLTMSPLLDSPQRTTLHDEEQLARARAATERVQKLSESIREAVATESPKRVALASEWQVKKHIKQMFCIPFCMNRS